MTTAITRTCGVSAFIAVMLIAGPLAAVPGKQYVGMTAAQLKLPRSLWCADFMNLVEKKEGRKGTNSRSATSFLSYGSKTSSPRPGDIVVLSRRGGGHVGYFVNWGEKGPRILSGNHNNRVAIAEYPKSRVLGYRRPSMTAGSRFSSNSHNNRTFR